MPSPTYDEVVYLLDTDDDILLPDAKRIKYTSESNFLTPVPKSNGAIEYLSDDLDELENEIAANLGTLAPHLIGDDNGVAREEVVVVGSLDEEQTTAFDDSDDDLVEITPTETMRNSFKHTPLIIVPPQQERPTPTNNEDTETIRRQMAQRISGYEQNRLMLVQGMSQWTQDLATLRSFILRGTENLKQLMERYRQGDSDMDEVEQVQAQVNRLKSELLQKESLVESSRRRLTEIDTHLHNLKLQFARPFAFASSIMGMPQQESFQQQPPPRTVYEGQDSLSDNIDLQTLLNNIRPDEDLEKGLEATPAEMTVRLMKHQRKGLTWMVRMEEANNRGGILADDMGLGKTIQAISLIIRNKPGDDAPLKITLVITPVSLMRQWAEEFRQKIKADCPVSVTIYHGENRKNLLLFSKLKRYDVVLTLYNTLQNEFKKHFAEELAKAKEEKRQSTWLPGRADIRVDDNRRAYSLPFFGPGKRFFRIILDEAQWIKNKNTFALRAVALLEAEYRFCMLGTPMQNNIEELFPILRFLSIRPYCFEDKFRTDIALPLKKLSSRRYDDFDREQLMKRLRAVLAAVMLRRTKTLKIDGKPILELPEKHLRRVDVHMDAEENSYYRDVEQKIQRSARKLLGQSKNQGLDGILALLTRLRQACLHQYLIEIGEYKRSLTDQAQVRFLRQWMKNWAGLYERVRLMTPAAIAVVKDKLQDTEDAFGDDLLADVACQGCHNWFSPGMDVLVVQRKCGHIFCGECVEQYFMDSEITTYKCPECVNLGVSGKILEVAIQDCVDMRVFDLVWRQNLSLDEFESTCRVSWLGQKLLPIETIIDTVISNHDGAFYLLAKMARCMELIESIYENHPGEKIIVFSQFTSLFDLMKRKFAERGLTFLRYDGLMSVESKNDTVKKFYQDAEAKVLMLSLKAGNVGLTLTCASHIIMMDPFWNPYVEDQAMDRAHRIGQQCEVYVHRLYIEGTVEQRILELQDHKRELIGAAMSETGLQTVARASKREIGFLFGLNRLEE